jgi:Cdc6-like AAA superfamily ATPase
VISNRDVASMNLLDQWLHYVDTEEVLPLFETLELDYNIPKLDAVDWDSYSELVRSVCRDNNLSSLQHLTSSADLRSVLDLLQEHNERSRLRDAFCHVLALEASSSLLIANQEIASTLLHYLPHAAYLTSGFLRSQTWRTHKSALEADLVVLAPMVAKGLILSSNELGDFVRQPFSILLRELKQLSLQNFSELVELITLTIRTSEAALDLLLDVLEPETARLLVGRPTAINQFTSSLFGIALDHIDKAADSAESGPESVQLTLEDYKDGYTIVKSLLRIDSAMSSVLKVGDHVRMTVTNSPQNDPVARPFSMDALVLNAEPGAVTFRCLHTPPAYLAQCAWSVAQCGSFVTSKTLFDAVMTFYTEREACCGIYASLLGIPGEEQIKLHHIALPFTRDPTLNASQNDALMASMKHPLTLIWGPPGTGKTHTIVVILSQLLVALPKSRFVVTAPTHNAVDNMLRRFVNSEQARISGTIAVRVSTQVSSLPFHHRSSSC